VEPVVHTSGKVEPTTFALLRSSLLSDAAFSGRGGLRFILFTTLVVPSLVDSGSTSAVSVGSNEDAEHGEIDEDYRYKITCCSAVLLGKQDRFAHATLAAFSQVIAHKGYVKSKQRSYHS
jgi:hypothetical protein